MARIWRANRSTRHRRAVLRHEPPDHAQRPEVERQVFLSEDWNRSAAWRPVAEVVGQTTIMPINVGTPSLQTKSAAVESTYRPMPYRPDTVVDGWSTDSLTVRGASIRGYLHRATGAPRQDDLAVHRLPNGTVIALVADGVSEAQQSHIGSTVAVRSAAEWLYSSLAEETGATDWHHCLASIAWALSEQCQRLLNLDEPDAERAEGLLATTLVCAVVEPIASGALRAHVFSVGDSGAWLLSGGTFRDVLAGSRSTSEGFATSEVTALPRVPNAVEVVVLDIQIGDVLLLGTDGFGDPLGDGSGGVGNLFREVLTGAGVPSLIEFAHALDFSRDAFDDDRTLAAIWPDNAMEHPNIARTS